MAYSHKELCRVYDRASGYCHICGKKLAFSNYARLGWRGAWEVEHSRPRTRGGSNRLGNLFPAHVECNRDKGIVSTRAARMWYGRLRAPLSRQRRLKAKRVNAVAGGILGALIGSIAGPASAALGILIGASLGYKSNPDEES